MIGGYDAAGSLTKLGATLANASESPPPASPPASPPYGTTTTLTGSGTSGWVDGDSTTAQFYHPSGVAIAPSGAFAFVAVRTWPAPPLPRRVARSRRRRPRLAPALGTHRRALC